MSVREIHTLMEDNGIPIYGVREVSRGRYAVDFRPEAVEADKTNARTLISEWAGPTEAEVMARIAPIRDQLIDKLLIRAFYPDAEGRT